MKQNEIIKQLSDKELKQQVWLSQWLLFIVAVVLSFFFFDSMKDWLKIIKWDGHQIFYYGLLPGLGIVFIDIILFKFISKEKMDDGGVNERIFNSSTIPSIFLLTFFVALSEEILFRGVIQTTFGYIFASFLFAIIHFRYLRKTILLLSVFIISFIIGYLFELTNNLLVTITLHFVVDFLLGLQIHFHSGGRSNE